MMRAWHTSAHYSTSTGPYVTCGFAIWFATALFKYWWNNDNYNEIYLKSAPVVQWIMASSIAFGAGSIYDISTRAFSTLSFGLGNFGRNSISGQSLVNLWFGQFPTIGKSDRFSVQQNCGLNFCKTRISEFVPVLSSSDVRTN